MALRGTAALAMWWDVAAHVRAEFEHWHSHEHFPERLALPGFLRATRWSDARGGEGIFVMYELAAHDVLSSPAYVARLNAPTPWSARMMPHHRGMVRTQCRVLESRGIAVARHAATVRFAPRKATDAARLRAHLAAFLAALVMQPGLTGAHLLQHEAPALAQAYGGYGAVVETNAEFVTALAAARDFTRNKKLPALIELRCDPDVITPSTTISAMRAAKKA